MAFLVLLLVFALRAFGVRSTRLSSVFALRAFLALCLCPELHVRQHVRQLPYPLASQLPNMPLASQLPTKPLASQTPRHVRQHVRQLPYPLASQLPIKPLVSQTPRHVRQLGTSFPDPIWVFGLERIGGGLEV